MNEAYYYFYHSMMVLSLLGSLFIVVLSCKHRRANGAKAMIALAVATFVWAFGYLAETYVDTLAQKQFFTNIGYIGSMSVPPSWFVFAVNYGSGNRLLYGWRNVPICIVPLFIVILVWTNNWHYLMWFDEHMIVSGPFVTSAKTYGPFFWVALAYNYILIISGAVVLIRRLFIGTRLYIGQAVSLITAVCLPFLWNIIYVFNLVPMPRKDLTPVMFAISGLAIVTGVMRFRLFTAMPFARRFIIQHLNDGVLVFDMDDRLLEANPAALKVLGAGQGIIGGLRGELAPAYPLLERLSSLDFGSTEISLSVSSEERIYEMETLPMRDSRGRNSGWLAILHDITERRQQEQEYRTIIQTTSEGFWITDSEGRFLDVNDAYCRIVGYSRDELLKMQIKDIEAAESPEEVSERISRIKKAGKDRFETRHRHKDGGIIDVEITTNYTGNDGGRLYVFIRDITERKKLQSQLIAQDRLASIGELTSGVAHELNNPLASILGYSDLLLKMELPEKIAADLDIIGREAERAARIIDNLLTFARRQPEEKMPVYVSEIINNTLELRAHEHKTMNIKTVTHLAPRLPAVLGNDFQLRQVFLNIIINAEYFMLEAHKEGTLTITTELVGETVRISFADDGPGIPPDKIAHLFDPFYTTKEVGKGTGLGLSICHGIVAEHNGRILVESQPGEGAVFTVELPVYKKTGSKEK